MDRRTFMLASAGAILSFRLSALESTSRAPLPDELDDVRDLWVRPWSIDRAFTLIGKVSRIGVAPKGSSYIPNIREEDGNEVEHRYRTTLHVYVDMPSGAPREVVIGYDDDLLGIYDGDVVEIAGLYMGTITGNNALGGEVSAPFVEASTIKKFSTSESSSKSTNPIEPIAYAPQAAQVIQSSMVNSPAKAMAGEPLVLVITSFEFPTETIASDSFQSMCDDIAAWYITVGGAAYWQDASVEANDVCGVAGTPEGDGIATILERFGNHMLSLTAGGGADLNATKWLESFMTRYPYTPDLAITDQIPISWKVQKTSGDVTDTAITKREARP